MFRPDPGVFLGCSFWVGLYGFVARVGKRRKKKKPEKSLTRILLNTILMRSEVQWYFDIRTTFHSVSRDLALASAFQQLRGQIRPGPCEQDRWGREFLRGSLRGSCVEKAGGPRDGCVEKSGWAA